MREKKSKKVLYREEQIISKCIPTSKKLLIESKILENKIVISSIPKIYFKDIYNNEFECYGLIKDYYIDFTNTFNEIYLDIYSYYKLIPTNDINWSNFFDSNSNTFWRQFYKCIIHDPINYIYKDCISYSRFPLNKKSCKCQMKRYYYNKPKYKIDYKPCLRDAKKKIIILLKFSYFETKKFIVCHECLVDLVRAINISYFPKQKDYYYYEIDINNNIYTFDVSNKVKVFDYDIYSNMINIILNIKFKLIDVNILDYFKKNICSYL